MSFLASISEITPIDREHYGENEGITPNDHCYWDGNRLSHNYGWNETDDHLRERIKTDPVIMNRLKGRGES